MNLIYTELSEEFIDGITELDRLCFTIPWSRNLFVSELHSKNAFYLIAKCNSDVVGYCGINYVCGEGRITNIAVHPEYRNKGIASALLEKMINFAESKSLEFITLEVRESNINAIKLYEKYGFQKVGERKNYYSDNHETALLMTKRF